MEVAVPFFRAFGVCADSLAYGRLRCLCVALCRDFERLELLCMELFVGMELLATRAY